MLSPSAPEATYWLIDALLDGVPVRRTLDDEHIRRLAEVLEHCPAILVTADGTIVDGRHRLAAARRIGWVRIPAIVLSDGQPGAELLAAMAANSSHGLPLSRRERRAGVRALLELRPDLSNRAVAQECGVARTVVADVRTELARSGGRSDHLNARTGSDGKQYPVDGQRGRAVVEALVRVDRDLSVRELAELAGVSVGAAHAQRRRVLSQLEDERWLVRWFRLLRARWLLRSMRRRGRPRG